MQRSREDRLSRHHACLPDIPKHTQRFGFVLRDHFDPPPPPTTGEPRLASIWNGPPG
ncbi:hypothetical protein CCP4SC76_390033 [Gammaproteobacteria bacterium]